jgi:hypothetical protein
MQAFGFAGVGQVLGPAHAFLQDGAALPVAWLVFAD